MVKSRWKITIIFCVLWIMLPILLILAIQEKGTLKLEKKDSLEDVLPFIIVGNMKEEFHVETVKAMAVILRSNYRKMLEDEKIMISDIKKKYTYLRKESYIKNQNIYELALLACQETQGEILTYENYVCYCPFFYLSSGITRDAFSFFEESEYPYLISVPSHRDEECDTYLSYHYFSAEEFDTERKNRAEQKEENKGESNEEEGKEKSMENVDNGKIQILETDKAGYVTWIKAGDEVMGGEAFRKRYGLPSSCFSVEQEENQIRIICRGIGHGFGFSQYGANVMAREGKDYRVLLKHYFPELSLEKSV